MCLICTEEPGGAVERKAREWKAGFRLRLVCTKNGVAFHRALLIRVFHMRSSRVEGGAGSKALPTEGG